MLMFQVFELASARGRAAEAGVREVFEVSLPVRGPPAPRDMRGAIVSLSEPAAAEAWPGGGPA